MFCGRCGAENDTDASFCRSCGSVLANNGIPANDGLSTPSETEMTQPIPEQSGTYNAFSSGQYDSQFPSEPYGAYPSSETTMAGGSYNNHFSDATQQYDFSSQPTDTFYNTASSFDTYSAPSYDTNTAPAFDSNTTSTAGNSSSPNVSAMSAQQHAHTSARNRNILIASIAAVAVIILAAAAFFVVPEVQTLTLPELTEERILSDFEDMSYGSQAELTNSQWASNSGFELTDLSIADQQDSDIEDPQTGDTIHTQNATGTMVYENDCFRVTFELFVSYAYIDDEWVLQDSYESDGATVEPIAGIDDETLLASVPTFLQMIDDDNPYEDSEGDTVYLTDLYTTNTDFQISENSTTADGGSVVFDISATEGIAEYHGTLTVDFIWQDNDWNVSSVSVDDSAYQKDYSPFVGTWTGTFESTHNNTVMDQAACYGGQGTPLNITVNSVDNQSATATVDMTFLIHQHGVPDNAVNSYDGDTVITVEDALVSLENNSSSYYEVYQSSDPTGYSIEFYFGDAGTFQAKVLTDVYFKTSTVWRTDYFTMTKSS